MNNDGMQPGLVRKDLYAYLESQGFEMTEERHKMIKNAIVLHTNTANAAERRDRQNALDAMHNAKIKPAMATMMKRMEKKQCPMCGLDLKKISEHEYEPACNHFPKNVRISIG
jgi:hypothetical protein